MTDTAISSPVLAGTPAAERDVRLEEGADELASRRSDGRLLGNERFLLGLAATTMTIGLSLILLGWAGAAGSTILEEQVPYLISGGLLGLALATIGAAALLAHWLTVLIRENRAFEAVRRQEHEALLAALQDALGARPSAPPVREGGANGAGPRGARAQRPLRKPTGGQ